MLLVLLQVATYVPFVKKQKTKNFWYSNGSSAKLLFNVDIMF